MSEHQEQVALIEWATLYQAELPLLWLLFAVPNGGARHPLVAMKMQREGVKPGVPDLFLPVARQGFHGLFIEMKFGYNDLSDEQKEWKRELVAAGYKHVTCWAWDAAALCLLRYFGIPDTEVPRMLGRPASEIEKPKVRRRPRKTS